MSSILWKSFNFCFSKFKCFPTIAFSPPPPTAVSIDEQDQHQKFPITTNPTLFKNLNYLYDGSYSDVSTSKCLTFFSSTSTAADAAGIEENFLSFSSKDSDDEWVPDFTSALASHRFFFSSPGSSNSILEPVEPPLPHDSGSVVRGGVAVQTYSPDPYSDFRKSMLEMIEARDSTDVMSDWEFLNDLLLCYLTLNPKLTHKFIVGAFADVLVSLVSTPPRPTPNDNCRKSHLQQHCATSDISI